MRFSPILTPDKQRGRGSRADSMPNLFAFLMLALWPVASAVLFRRLPPGRAIIASLLIAYLFLPPPPAGFDFPLLPPLTKETIPSLVMILACLILYRGQISLLPDSRLGKLLVLLFIGSPLATVLTNTEPVIWDQMALPALKLREALSMMIQQAMLIAPLLLARNFLHRPEDHRDMLKAVFVGGMAYSVLMLVEVRLSPQLNIWVYGFFQHNFDQMIRFGGFRPIVFLYHGLWVSFFTMTAVIAAIALGRGSGANAPWYWLSALYLAAVLVLSKSLGAILFAMVLIPLVLVLPARAQVRVAALLVVMALAYPVLKGADLIPQEPILQLAEQIAPDRANSLRFRFQQEEVLLDRATEKPLFGWGLWGRNHIWDGVTQRILTVTDGRWIILIGVMGWLGFLAEFGVLALPVLLTWRYARRSAVPLSPWIGPMCLLLGINLIDLIPNATLTPLTWLLAGAILGYAERPAPEQQSAPARYMLRSVL